MYAIRSYYAVETGRPAQFSAPGLWPQGEGTQLLGRSPSSRFSFSTEETEVNPPKGLELPSSSSQRPVKLV